MKKYGLIVLVAILMAIGGVLLFTKVDWDTVSVVWATPISQQKEYDPLLEEIKRDLRKYYFEDISDQKMQDNMRKGLVGQTHKYCFYVEKGDDSPKKIMGAFIVVNSGHYIVRYVVPEYPACVAGIQEGDEILGFNGKSITHIKNVFAQKDYLSIDSIDFKILRKNQIINVTVNKKDFTTPTIICKSLDDFLYVRINKFEPQTRFEFLDYINKFSDAKGYILDLRNNPGGSFGACKYICSYFLPLGKIVLYLKFKSGAKQAEISDVKKNCVDKPLVILINGNSWSAAEVIPAVLQYQKRAVVVGEQSGGKGIGQMSATLQNGDILMIPVAWLFLPDGTTWNENGVVPDYEIMPGPPILTFGEMLPQNDPQLKKAVEILENKTKSSE